MSEWLISRKGGQEGPFTAKQIGELLAKGELKANEAYAWKEGMPEWKKIAESGVLAEASLGQDQPARVATPTPTPSPSATPTPSQVHQPAPQAASSVNPYATPATVATPSSNFDNPLDYPGIGRLAYLGLQIGLSVVAYAILFVAILGAGAGNSPEGALIGVIVVVLIAVVGGLYIGVKRVQNLGMSGWAILWSFVPIISIWISWRMFACPAGYEHHKQLDTPGKILTGIMIGLFVLSVVVNIIAAANS
ncbi:GYF domain-containing protein [Haloferula sp.]|uniref:GYF domain-containing protein n=1 Tax=Haloferula sp. TaxID=2497595 RepID=UPI00329C6EB1